jgi:hypothetical protein
LARRLLSSSLAVCLVFAVGSGTALAQSEGGAAVTIPEPLLFDMVLPLGAQQGQLEVNSIFRVPLDSGEVIIVPEIEGAVLDGLTFELEIEFAGTRQTGWNELIGLYIPAFRFDPTWSLLVMLGARVPVEGDDSADTKLVFNATVFAQPNDGLVVAVETNYHADTRRSESFSVITSGSTCTVRSLRCLGRDRPGPKRYSESPMRSDPACCSGLVRGHHASSQDPAALRTAARSVGVSRPTFSPPGASQGCSALDQLLLRNER